MAASCIAAVISLLDCTKQKSLVIQKKHEVIYIQYAIGLINLKYVCFMDFNNELIISAVQCFGAIWLGDKKGFGM